MAKISVVTPERVRAEPLPTGFSGTARAEAYCTGPHDAIHLHLVTIRPQDSLTIGPLAVDCAAFIWSGEVTAGSARLAAGSSAIAEHGGQVIITNTGSADALVLCFAGAGPSLAPLAGGGVHLLPTASVPTVSGDPRDNGVTGRLHADSACPGCSVWLHENVFPAGLERTPVEAARSIHSHSEAEIIFVTAGAMRLGRRLVGPGTAIAIAADTLYGFTAGPEGLSFVNFRAAMPGEVQYASGKTMNEIAYWRERVPRPEYLAPSAA